MYFWPFFWWTVFLTPPLLEAKPLPVDYFAVLDCDPYATILEVRAAYWSKAKLYHPDIHPGNEEKLKAVIVAYDYIRENYNTMLRPPRKPVQADPWKGVSIYRVLDKYAPTPSISLPSDACDNDVMIYCLLGGQEFRFKLKKGQRLPVTLKFQHPDVTLHIRPESIYEYEA